MRKSILLAFLVLNAPLFGAEFTATVTGDTFIRNDDTKVDPNGDADTDNEILVGDNAGSLRGLLAFNLSKIINDLNASGGGDFANLVIHSAKLEIFERRGFSRSINITVNAYGFDFVPNTAIWNLPAKGDATAGGTIGTMLGGQNVTWNQTPDDQSAVISLSASGLKSALKGLTRGGRINFLLNSTTTGMNSFLSITSDRAPDVTRHAKLTIDYTVAPASGSK